MKNREIKFRAYVAQKGWIQGFNLINCHDYYTKGLEPKLSRYNSEWDIKDIHLMQFTGLKDKNGVDIYEGDVIRILYTDWPSNTDPNISLEDYMISISHIGEVIYEAPSFGILFFKEDRYGERPVGTFNYGVHGRLEVIGNIYEHPHLLTPQS